MTDWQERVIIEKFDLDEKINSLGKWLMLKKSSAIDAIDLELLRVQITAMQTYSRILGMRISRFK